MSKLLALFGEKEARILVLGLDNAGKTTILCEQHRRRFCCFESAAALAQLPLPAVADRLQVGEVVSTIPSKLCLWHKEASCRETT